MSSVAFWHLKAIIHCTIRRIAAYLALQPGCGVQMAWLATGWLAGQRKCSKKSAAAGVTALESGVNGGGEESWRRISAMAVSIEMAGGVISWRRLAKCNVAKYQWRKYGSSSVSKGGWPESQLAASAAAALARRAGSSEIA